MPHTQNLTNLDGSRIGTTSLAIIVELLSVFQTLKISAGEDPAGGVGEMGIKRLEVGLRARLRISMLKTSQAFP
jgi:hypothetical protein